jgi:hypothetical protein
MPVPGSQNVEVNVLYSRSDPPEDLALWGEALPLGGRMKYLPASFPPREGGQYERRVETCLCSTGE